MAKLTSRVQLGRRHVRQCILGLAALATALGVDDTQDSLQPSSLVERAYVEEAESDAQDNEDLLEWERALGVDPAVAEQKLQESKKVAAAEHPSRNVVRRERARPTTAAAMELALQRAKAAARARIAGSPPLRHRREETPSQSVRQDVEQQTLNPVAAQTQQLNTNEPTLVAQLPKRTSQIHRNLQALEAKKREQALAAKQLQLEQEKAQLQNQLEQETEKHRLDYTRMKEQIELEQKAHVKNSQEMKALESKFEQLKHWKDHFSAALHNETRNVEQESAKFWRDKAAVESERNQLVEKLGTMQKQLKSENDKLRLEKDKLQNQLVQNNQTINTLQEQYQQEKATLTNQFKTVKNQLYMARSTMKEDVDGLRGQLNQAKIVNEQLLKNVNELTEAKVQLEAKLVLNGPEGISARAQETKINQTADALRIAQEETEALTRKRNEVRQKLNAVRAKNNAATSDMKSKFDAQQQPLSEAREKQVTSMKYQRNDAIAALVALLIVMLAVPCFFWTQESASLSPLSLLSAAARQAIGSADTIAQARDLNAHGGYGSK